jgi:hypothetical protein
MIAVLAIVTALIVVAVATGVLSRRRATERARVERERAVIAAELSGPLMPRQAGRRHVV